jgi:protein-S-isoprenylcysteine O-methyltransferase Ste14
MLRGIIFVILSGALVYVSRASLKTPRSHGFYRFLAWECILGLFFLNFVSFGQWFDDPLSARQLLSWALLIGCLVPGGYGIHHLRTRGKVDAGRDDDETLVWIERTTRLVTTGVYRYIRHPLYSSLLLLAWGVFLKRPSWHAGGLALAATAFLVATAKIEEAEDIQYFGAAYREYMKHSRMFIPFVF